MDPSGHVSEAVLESKILGILGIAYAAKAAMGALIAKVTAILLIIAPYLAIVIVVLAIAVATYVAVKAVQQSKTKSSNNKKQKKTSIPSKLRVGNKVKTPDTHPKELKNGRNGEKIHTRTNWRAKIDRSGHRGRHWDMRPPNGKTGDYYNVRPDGVIF